MKNKETKLIFEFEYFLVYNGYQKYAWRPSVNISGLPDVRTTHPIKVAYVGNVFSPKLFGREPYKLMKMFPACKKIIRQNVNKWFRNPFSSWYSAIITE